MHFVDCAAIVAVLFTVL